MRFLKQHLKEHPNLSRVLEASKDVQDVLIWAQGKGYVLLPKAPNGELLYSKEDLDKAFMWREKDAD